MWYNFSKEEFHMRRLLVDEVVSSWHNGGSIETTYSKDEVMEAVYRSLTGTNRFNAVTEQRHTVFTHSWYVGILAADMAPAELKDLARLMGMVHDFGETVVGDFVMPMKSGAYKEVYEEYYLPLELAFRSFVGEEVLGISGFDDRFKSVKEHVDRADSIVGDLELYGDVLEMDEETHRLVNTLFDEMEASVSVEEFDDTLRQLAGKFAG
jgi:5'-deoxynucleotidase YfbR-like HD superfamily hydrolase